MNTTTTDTAETIHVGGGLPPIECKPWCSAGDGHIGGALGDRSCYGMVTHVELSREEPEQIGDSSYLKVVGTSLEEEPFTEPTIVVCIEGQGVVRLAFDEWERFILGGNAAV